MAGPLEPPAAILVVDDDRVMRETVGRILQPMQFALRTAESGETALELLAAQPAQVVVADHEMPGMNGITLLGRVRQLSPHAQRVLLTGLVDVRAVEEASLRGEVDRYVPKPFDAVQLRVALRSAVAQYRVDVENAELHALTSRKNQELEQLNATLEARVQRRTEELARAKMEWESSFDAISDPLAIVTRGRVVRRANLAYAHHGGRDIRSALGMTCHQALFGRDEVCESCPLDAVDSGNARSQIRVGRSTFRVLAYPLGAGEAVCYYRDVTVEEEVARQLVRSEKLTAAGQLAAGVAHEINNPLASILALSQMMKTEAGRTAADIEALRLIESSALRGKYIVETLLRFVRQPRRDERGPVDLNPVCTEAVALIRPQIQDLDVELALELPAQPTWALGNSNHLAQVLINLLQNAVHAVGTRGRIRIWCGPRGDGVALQFSDDGPGISTDILSRLYEPFL